MLSRQRAKNNQSKPTKALVDLKRGLWPAFSVIRAKRWCVIALLGLLSACTLQPPTSLPTPSFSAESTSRQALVNECFDFYQQLSQTAQRSGIIHAPTNSLDDFPYLRSNRFLASFSQASTEPDMSAWLVQLNQLAVKSLIIEWQQLPMAQRREFMGDRDKPRRALIQELQGCGVLLITDLLRKPQQWPLVVEQSQVADHYSILKRSLGFYPIVKPFFKRGVRDEIQRLQSERQAYRDQVIGVADRETIYRVNSTPIHESHHVRDAVRAFDYSQDALGIPQLTTLQRQALLTQWRPHWAIEKTQSLTPDFDQPGRVLWAVDQLYPVVDTAEPVQYEFLSFGRWQGQTTLQLNYSVWFSERPASGPWDLLAGHLDAVFWRVHLSLDGQPLAYDSIHGCGCWYQLYPAAGFDINPVNTDAEPFLIGQINMPSEEGERGDNISAHKPVVMQLHLRARDHQLMGVTQGAGSFDRVAVEGQRIRGLDFEELYGLPFQPEGSWDGNPVTERRSLFAMDGLVPSSVRGERWLFWPMGIASPGAMRAPGTHAIAFVGRRHFDAPDLLNQLGLFKK